MSGFQLYTPFPNQSKRLALSYLKMNSLHNISKTLKNIATDRYVFLFVFERNKQFCFSIKKIQIVGEQNVLTEIINLRHCEVPCIYKNRYYIASKCGIFDRNYDIWLKYSCSGTLPRPKYSGTLRRCDLRKWEMWRRKEQIHNELWRNQQEHLPKQSLQSCAQYSFQGSGTMCYLIWLDLLL